MKAHFQELPNQIASYWSNILFQHKINNLTIELFQTITSLGTSDMLRHGFVTDDLLLNIDDGVYLYAEI